ncbi:hypothetical protein LTR70_008165 [Exophiala xenobiotica]|uniref:Uncharacterized protein n=1 Tax=Lithohypha guttulata TaxID=1690604 RepID=A0ABR0K260_9EURO|nr:hypothetical protein LTR24_007752 [Lithohypha guttulata]KAK5312484.1 hypothetical protein LTR70_008165 [Exophiala xenobiotica]
MATTTAYRPHLLTILRHHGHAPASPSRGTTDAMPPQPPSPLSPAQSSSEDGFSVVSHSETFDLKHAETVANDPCAPVQQPHISKELNRMTELNDTLTLELSQIKEQHDEVLGKIETQNAAQHGKDNYIREQLETLSQNINKPIPDIPSLIQNYEQDKKELASLQWYLDTSKNHIRLLQRQKIENLAEKARLNLENTTLTTEAEARTKELTALQNDRISAESQAKADARTIAELKSNSRVLRTHIDSLEQQTADLKLNLTTLDIANKALNTRKTKLKRSISKRDSQITDLQNEIAVRRADCLDDEDQIQTLHDEIARLEAVREDLEDELADRGAEVAGGKVKLHNARWRGHRLKKQRDGARAAKAVC